MRKRRLGHALACRVAVLGLHRDHGLRVLFDAGLSDAWRFYADHAGIDLETTDIVALSHIHRDHTKGLLHHPFQSKKPILLHPRVLEPPPAISGDKGAAEDYARIQRVIRCDFEVMACRDPVEFRPGAFFLGEIPRRTTPLWPSGPNMV